MNFPCWLRSDDQEVAQALLKLEWFWLKDEEPESWEDKGWKYKIGCCGGWQFWGVPGETCLLVVCCGAVFGLCLEGTKLDFEGELSKARSAIAHVLEVQQARRPLQLCLFEVSRGLR